MRKLIKNVIRLLLGLVILSILFYKVGFTAIYGTLLKTNFLYFPLVLFFYVLNFLIGTLNIKILLMPVNKKIPFWKLLKYGILSWSLGLFVPAKLGEFALVVFLKRLGLEMGKGMVVALIDKIATMIVLTSLAAVAFLRFFTPLQTIKLLGMILTVGIVMAFFLLSETGRGFIKRYVLRKYAERFIGFSKTFFYYLEKQRGILLLNLGITVVKWVVSALIIYSTFFMFTNKIPTLMVIILISSIVSISSIIPVTIGGLGVRESVAVALYALVGVAGSVTASVYLILLVLCYLTAAIVIGFLVDEIPKLRKN
jgi:hypothetical protein